MSIITQYYVYYKPVKSNNVVEDLKEEPWLKEADVFLFEARMG